MFTAEPPRWFEAVDRANQGGKALADYADVLVWGQGEAQRAIEMFTQAQAASRAAAAQYEAWAQSSTANEVRAAFSDPGETLAQEAQAVLDNARGLLEQAGDGAARMFGLEPDGEGGFKKDIGGTEWGSSRRDKQRRWDPESGQWVEEDPGGWQRHRGGSSWSGQWGSQSEGMLHDAVKETLEQFGIDIPTKEWEGSANVDVLGGGVEGEFDSGDWAGSGKLEGSLLGAGADAHASASALGVEAGASAEAYLAKGSAQGELNYGEHTSLSGTAEASVGAEASAEGSIGLTGAQGRVGGFVGGQAGVDGNAEIAGVNAGGHAEVRYGLGAEASGQFGMGDDGKFHIGASAGLTVGVGASLGFDIAIDPGEVVDTVQGVADDVGEVASDVAGGVADAAEGVVDFVGGLF
ncbi:hypothetical protein JHE00_21005 [Prauserella sp. ASG 168]|uniref:Putative T7SS secretion signal domain-containing protein n=1 Tax=Prauserella cavernicola TaxID=2800127 RepID=A0A934QUZ3_9PSEU|nr:hypothetical protein [Prauserella cavernicola]MBK1786811.1 hypothetical protein [Prauserella cavernicola]